MTIVEPGYETLPKSRIRRVTAKRMRASVAAKPPVTLHRTVDASGLAARLESARSAAPGDVRPTFTSVLAVALARTLEADPVMNSCLVEDDELRRYDEVHLAVAVSTDAGLVAPVLRPADLADDVAAAAALRSLGELARSGSLRPEHLVPATFTLTSLGGFGIEYFTPILNPPQVGILGVGTLVEATADAPVRLPLSLTFDHAALDGVDGARFLATLAAAIGEEEA